MKANYINLNGNLVSENGVSLQINRAMRFGDGMFETIRIINGKPVWWQEHIERLKSGLEYLSIDIPSLFFDELLVDSLQLITKNQIKLGGVLRILIYRKGEGAGYTPITNKFDYLIETSSLEDNLFELNKKGLKIEISETVQIALSEDLLFKSLNKIPYVKASVEKVKRGFDELLLKNNKGSIVDACASAFFTVKNDIFYFPKLTSGALNSITRNKVISNLKYAGYKVEETSITIKMIEESDELFLVNSIIGIRWVGFFRKSRYFHRNSNLILSMLNRI